MKKNPLKNLKEKYISSYDTLEETGSIPEHNIREIIKYREENSDYLAYMSGLAKLSFREPTQVESHLNLREKLITTPIKLLKETGDLDLDLLETISVIKTVIENKEIVENSAMNN